MFHIVERLHEEEFNIQLLKILLELSMSKVRPIPISTHEIVHFFLKNTSQSKIQ